MTSVEREKTIAQLTADLSEPMGGDLEAVMTRISAIPADKTPDEFKTMTIGIVERAMQAKIAKIERRTTAVIGELRMMRTRVPLGHA
ncbi:MAG: hypothetical protein M3541_05615 [Acidobacteriota bacterium]|nr:hypothetical protein [Acidobacteriota bacterium]MDQ3418248.1 hypothetical protein [Acidobacteriota bacterium]